MTASLASIDHFDLAEGVVDLSGQGLDVFLQTVVFNWVVLVEHWHDADWSYHHQEEHNDGQETSRPEIEVVTGAVDDQQEDV